MQEEQKIHQIHSELNRPVATGGIIIVANEDTVDFRELIDSSARNIDSSASIESFSLDKTAKNLDSSDITVFEELGIAVVDHNDGEEGSMAIASRLKDSSSINDVYPEFFVYPIESVVSSPLFTDTSLYTWGIQAVSANNTNYDGNGSLVAVLDTGVDLSHPDLSNIRGSKSFVVGETVQDMNGHGTHCCGTVAGSMSSSGMPRYGVAPGAELLVGKVLSNAGSGRPRDIIAGMMWSIQQGADVISMSLGRATRQNEKFEVPYERAARRALNNDTLVIAACGNESDRRYGYLAPVSSPANCPSIMSVAAVDQSLVEANFSCAGLTYPVDISAPGVNIYSAWPMPRKYRSISGTSMACPHVAGVAALFAQSNPAFRGSALANELTKNALNINRSSRDTGAGLVQAP